MRKFFRSTALAAMLLAAIPAAQAATQTYSFSGMLDSGYYNGQSYSGLFSFDDAGLTGVDAEWLSVGNFSFNFLGNTYTLANAAAPVEVGYYNGTFLGVSYAYSSANPSFSLIAGSFDASEAFLAYDSSLGLSGAGSVIYATAPVPEPETYAMFLAGLGLIGLIARRRV